jgi:predicted TIM-barrel fold metal-dependent hydrolase
MDAHGVDKSVVFGFPWTRAETFREHNDYVMEAVRRFPDRLIGMGCMDPFSALAEEETMRCLEGGLSGIGELAFYRSGIDAECLDRLDPLMAACRERRLPVLIHTNEPVGHLYPGKTPNTLRQIYDLVRRFPQNTIVLAHWGGGVFFFSLLRKEVKDSLANVYFDTAASPFLYDPSIYPLALKLAGPHKILFGSDFPLIPPSRYFKELEGIGLSAQARDDILGNNAARLMADCG